MAHRHVVAIVGGGFTGAALAYHLVRMLPRDAVRTVIYEPRASLGAGLAYDTDEPVYRINVPAARMSLVPGDDRHFERWLLETGVIADDPEATVDGHVFARRSDFGRYVSAQLTPLVAQGALEHRRARVRAIAQEKGGWMIEADDGSWLFADVLVVATTHPRPQAPSVLDRTLAGHPKYVPDATVRDALQGIGPQDRVLVVGAGLTAADVIARLDAAGHGGLVTAVSRRGLRSRGHNLAAQDPFGDFVDPPIVSARTAVRRIRRAIDQALAEGLTWHAVFDRLRGQGGQIWRALPLVERRRIVRFLRPYWDAHRFRIAPQVEAAIDRRLAARTLLFQAASVIDVVRLAGGEIAVTFLPRHKRVPLLAHFDAVVVTTGPDHRSILSSQPFLARLEASGTLQPDPVNLGIAVDEHSRALGKNGQPVESLFVAGPLARGTFGELMGLPQVTEHAVFVAETIARSIEAKAASGR